MRKIVTLIGVLFCICSNAQINTASLNGSWKGKTVKAFGVTNPQKITLELEAINDTLLTGVLHLAYKRGGFEHTKVTAIYKSLDSSFLLIEDSTVQYKISFFESICLGKAHMNVKKTDSSLLLSGTWKDKNRGLFRCPNMSTSYEKALIKTPVNIMQDRISDIQKVIDLDKKETDSIRIDLYDDAVVDKDSVTVYLNDSIILKNKMLTASPITFYISLDKTIAFNKIKLFADNLGEISPNTACMVITTKLKKYTLTLSSNLEKNGVVEFALKD